MNPLPENTKEGHMVMICRFSWHGVYNIPWLQRRKSTNANQIYFPAIFKQTGIHDSSTPHDSQIKFSETQHSHQNEQPSMQVHFYLGLSSFLVLPLSSDQCCIEAPARSKAPLKQHVCTVPTKRNARALRGGKNLGASVERAPATFSVPCKKDLVSRSWHLPGFGSWRRLWCQPF